jgi:hypothetical protein
VENKPDNPITKVSLHVYRIEEDTYIEKVWQGDQQQQRQDQLPQQRNVRKVLASLPFSVGNSAIQQVLQSSLIQLQQNHNYTVQME